MRGYFAVGVEGISKARNLGAVMRTAHAFGGSFVFTVGAANRAREMFQTDTAKTTENLPYYGLGDGGRHGLAGAAARLSVWN